MDIETGDSPTNPHMLGIKELVRLEKLELLFEVFLLWLVPLWSFQNELNRESPQDEGYVYTTEP